MMQVDFENAFNRVSQVILESCVMLGGLWRTLSPLLSFFMVFIILLITNMGGTWRGLSRSQVPGRPT
jgi:hypothetical protein